MRMTFIAGTVALLGLLAACQAAPAVSQHAETKTLEQLNQDCQLEARRARMFLAPGIARNHVTRLQEICNQMATRRAVSLPTDSRI